MLAESNDPLDQLLALKDEAFDAIARGDGDFYKTYLAEEAMALTPLGMLDKAAIVNAISGGSRFRSVGVDDMQASMVGQDVGLVIYRARFARPDGVDLTMLTSTLYQRTAEGWKAVFYQQTPLEPAQQTSGG